MSEQTGFRFMVSVFQVSVQSIGSTAQSNGSVRFDSVKPSQLSSTRLTQSTQRVNSVNPGDSVHSVNIFGVTTLEIWLVRCRSRLGFGSWFLCCISKTRHGWNRRTMKSRVLSGRSVARKT
uniref:Uncharacterized protein n=1 Tax=Helianthus annuus TaxID=4232 RepID=A0A251VR13_HELAN